MRAGTIYKFFFFFVGFHCSYHASFVEVQDVTQRGVCASLAGWPPHAPFVHCVLFVVLLTSTLVLNYCVPLFLDNSNVNTGQAEEESQIIIVNSNKQRYTLGFRGIIFFLPPPSRSEARRRFCVPAVQRYQKTRSEFLMNKRPCTHQRATRAALKIGCFFFFFCV